jgi:hypothetical protein
MLLGANRIDVLQQLAPPELWQSSLDWERQLVVIGASGESALSEDDLGLGLTHYLYAGVLAWGPVAEAGHVVDSDRLLKALDESRGKRREEMQAFYYALGYFANVAFFATALGYPAPRRLVVPSLFRVARRQTLAECFDELGTFGFACLVCFSFLQ